MYSNSYHNQSPKTALLLCPWVVIIRKMRLFLFYSFECVFKIQSKNSFEVPIQWNLVLHTWNYKQKGNYLWVNLKNLTFMVITNFNHTSLWVLEMLTHLKIKRKNNLGGCRLYHQYREVANYCRKGLDGWIVI